MPRYEGEEFAVRGASMTPEEAAEVAEAEEIATARRGGGGKRKDRGKGERTFGHGAQAQKKRAGVAIAQSKERRGEETASAIERHLREIGLSRDEAEVYRLWLEEAVSGEPFQESDVKGEIVPLRRHSPGGQHMQKKGKSYRAEHVPTKIVVYGSEGRDLNQKKREAIENLRERVEELAKSWRGYERDMGDGKALALFDEATGYQE